MQIPIVGARGTIVGWTDTVPKFSGAKLRHEEAERLIGSRIVCIYVQIEGAAVARRAGAPPDWRGPWRCLALCGEGMVQTAQTGNFLPVVHVESQVKA